MQEGISEDRAVLTQAWLASVDGVTTPQAELIASVMNVIRGARRSQALRAGSVTRTQASFLEYLKRQGPSRITAVAEGIGVDLSVLSRQAATLEQRGLIGRDVDSKDKRACLVRLTQEGQSSLEAFWTNHVQTLSAALSALPESDLTVAARVNSLVARALYGEIPCNNEQ